MLLGKCQCQLLSCVQLLVTPWIVAHQAPLPLEFSRQEYWSGQPFPSPGHLPNPRIKPQSPALQADSLPSKPPRKQKCCWGSSGSDLVTKLCPTLATPWTLACQAPLSMEFPRQEYWNRLSFPSPGDLSDPGVKPMSPAWQADSLPLSHQSLREQLLIAPERRKQLGQSGNSAQLWLYLLVKVKSDAAKNSIAQKPGVLGP